MEPAMQRVHDAMDKAIQSPAMHRIMMDVTDPLVIDKLVDAFIEGGKCGAHAMAQEVLLNLKGR